MPASSPNKRIARNVVVLYLKTPIVVLVNLYAARVILDILGVEDFGIYSVVGGIVALFTFLNTSMSGATSRFLIYELGKNDTYRLKQTFQVALFIHILIALAVVFMAETVGLWFLNNKIVIPEDRMLAANWVYQFSILTLVLKTIQVPYNASIIANEKMHIYVWIEIINAVTILTTVSLLSLWGGDKLVFYAFLMFVTSTCVFLTYSILCTYLFIECGFKILYHKSILLPMLTYSGWDLYGNLSVVAKTQGTTILINIFFGALMNAANAISVQIQSGVVMFANNVTLAFRPQIIKEYAANDLRKMESLMVNATRISLILLSMIAVPLFLEMPNVLKLWLKNVPDYTIIISRIALLTCCVGSINSIVIIPIHATGRIKWLSFANGSLYLLTLPCVYVLLSIYKNPEIVYGIHLFFMLVILLATSIILKCNISKFHIFQYYLRGVFPCISCIIVSSIITYLSMTFFADTPVRLLCVIMIYCLSTLLIIFIFINKEDKIRLKEFIVKKGFHKKIS